MLCVFVINLANISLFITLLKVEGNSNKLTKQKLYSKLNHHTLEHSHSALKKKNERQTEKSSINEKRGGERK